jgi:hypothetical protein
VSGGVELPTSEFRYATRFANALKHTVELFIIVEWTIQLTANQPCAELVEGESALRS